MVAPSRSEFLADHRVDEVGGALRQEFELALRAVEQALAEYAAGADGDLRLDDVIAGAELVRFRIEQREYALFLVFVEHIVPGEPGRGRASRRQAEHHAELQAGHDHHQRAADEDQAAGTEIRLQDGQAGGNQDDEREHHQGFHSPAAAAVRAATTRRPSAPRAS